LESISLGILVLSSVLEKVLSISEQWGYDCYFALIFKDTILGFVASIQMSVYDMVRVGDWISMPNMMRMVMLCQLI
jgi:miniconductance mechanosensitive channel